ncbi:MAG: SMC-Scp complex subunit ScpB [Thermodesulfobacteriota bacterium]
MTPELKHIIESLLFVSTDPLSLERIKKAIPEADVKEIREALQSLSKEYEDRTGGFFLSEVAGGYQIRTRPQCSDWIKRLLQPAPARLSRAAMETLAIVAYKQPVIRNDIEAIRGVDSGGVLRLLLERKLIRVMGRQKIPGRPLIYGTTRQFLEVFDLKDLTELPTPKEIEDLGVTPNKTPDDDFSEKEPQPVSEKEVNEGDEGKNA